MYDKIKAGEYTNKVDYKADKAAYREESFRILQQFRADGLEFAGLTGHPEADKAWDMAWDMGHSSGYSEVLGQLLKVADLLLD